jgi:hypothetical protein
MLNAVQRLIDQSAEDSVVIQEDEDEMAGATQLIAPLHLIDVKTGSARYNVASNDPEGAIKTLSDAGLSLQDPDHAELDPEMLSPIEELSRIAKSLECRIEFRKPGRGGDLLAIITSLSFDELARTAFVIAESSVFGYLERVGGAVERHCGLRLPTQSAKMVICPVESVDLVRALGQHVYENVRVSGPVTWFRKTGRVKTITVRAFEPSKKGSILEALEHIREAGGKAWDDVEDPEALIAEMRSR